MKITRVNQPPKLPPRPVEGHKGMFGRVLVVGGNHAMIGAPVLAGTAALRCGSGLVQIAVLKSNLPGTLSITPELIGLELEDDHAVAEAAEKADAIVLGPGLGQTPLAVKRVRQLIKIEKPMVIDADGLNILSAMKKWPPDFKAKAVLTPHPGEMTRLNQLLGRGKTPSDQTGRIELATFAASQFGVVLLLKGHRTVVTDGKRVYINKTGDSSLSKAGAGDVLSGILGCFLGQKMEGFGAAALAAHLHGRAGQMAGKKLGRRSVLARDVIGELGECLR